MSFVFDLNNLSLVSYQSKCFKSSFIDVLLLPRYFTHCSLKKEGKKRTHMSRINLSILKSNDFCCHVDVVLEFVEAILVLKCYKNV